MSTFLGVMRYEYHMAIRRWGVWLALLLAAVPYLIDPADYFVETGYGGPDTPVAVIWGLAGLAALQLNVLLPLVGGIAMADRLPRDSHLGVSDLLRSTPLSHWSYILGKYVGVVLATLTPAFLLLLARSGILLVQGVPIAMVPASLMSFLAITAPAFLFVGAFAIACTAVLPVRVFQVLFTGYWFWGNYLTPKVMPTLSETLLTPSGKYVAGGLFGTTGAMASGYTPVQAILNLLVLAACAAAALVALHRYRVRQERLA